MTRAVRRAQVRAPLAAVVLAAALAAGCGEDVPPEPPPFTLAAPALADGVLPPAHTCRTGGSPAVTWSGVPEGTAELVLVSERPGARPAARWLVAGIRPDAAGLPEALPHVSRDAGGIAGLRQGVNERGRIGWSGPCADGSGRAVRLRLLALDAPTRLSDGYDVRALERAIRGRVIGEADLTARAG